MLFFLKRNKFTNGYLITLALQSRGDMLYVGPNKQNNKKLKISPIVNAHVINRPGVAGAVL